jgi:hypothetical protein
LAPFIKFDIALRPLRFLFTKLLENEKGHRLALAPPAGGLGISLRNQSGGASYGDPDSNNDACYDGEIVPVDTEGVLAVPAKCSDLHAIHLGS